MHHWLINQSAIVCTWLCRIAKRITDHFLVVIVERQPFLGHNLTKNALNELVCGHQTRYS